MDNINQYSVYARPDSAGRVIKIFSSCFEQPADGDVLLKTGSGDEFVHTGYYNLSTPDGAHRYVIDAGSMREVTSGEIAAELLPGHKAGRITELKNKLEATDYQAMKYMEGWLSEVEYAAVKAQRQIWRNEINQLESEIIALEG